MPNGAAKRYQFSSVNMVEAPRAAWPPTEPDASSTRFLLRRQGARSRMLGCPFRNGFILVSAHRSLLTWRQRTIDSWNNVGCQRFVFTRECFYTDSSQHTQNLGLDSTRVMWFSEHRVFGGCTGRACLWAQVDSPMVFNTRRSR